jgi:hypothetical protein
MIDVKIEDNSDVGEVGGEATSDGVNTANTMVHVESTSPILALRCRDAAGFGGVVAPFSEWMDSPVEVHDRQRYGTAVGREGEVGSRMGVERGARPVDEEGCSCRIRT